MNFDGRITAEIRQDIHTASPNDGFLVRTYVDYYADGKRLESQGTPPYGSFDGLLNGSSPLIASEPITSKKTIEKELVDQEVKVRGQIPYIIAKMREIVSLKESIPEMNRRLMASRIIEEVR